MWYEIDRTTYGYHRAMVLEAAQKLWEEMRKARDEGIFFYAQMNFEKDRHPFFFRSVKIVRAVEPYARKVYKVLPETGELAESDIKKKRNISQEEKDKILFWLRSLQNAGKELAKALNSAMKDFHVFRVRLDSPCCAKIEDKRSFVRF